ncbi:MAG: hypothetical protein WBQ39_12790, partial [Terriglobales bacterium]
MSRIHQMVMLAMRKKFGLGLVCGRLAIAMMLVVLAAICAAAQPAEKTAPNQSPNESVDRYYEPLPRETGAAGLKLMLRRLHTTGR